MGKKLKDLANISLPIQTNDKILVERNSKGYSTDLKALMDTKQEKLVSGTSIKTVNGQSLLGSGNITIDIPETDMGDYPTTTEVQSMIDAAITTVLNTDV